MTELTDAQLIERSQRGPAAFEELFARHFTVIHRFLRRRTRRPRRATHPHAAASPRRR